MKRIVFVALVVLLLAPSLAGAFDPLGCDVWLENGNVLMWTACRVASWVAFNQDVGDGLREAGFDNPL